MAGGINIDLVERIYDVKKYNSSMTCDFMARALIVPLRTLQREMSELQKANRIKRVGGNRYSHWEIMKE